MCTYLYRSLFSARVKNKKFLLTHKLCLFSTAKLQKPTHKNLSTHISCYSALLFLGGGFMISCFRSTGLCFYVSIKLTIEHFQCFPNTCSDPLNLECRYILSDIFPKYQNNSSNERMSVKTWHIATEQSTDNLTNMVSCNTKRTVF